MDSGLTPVVPSFTGPSLSRPHHDRPALEALEHYKLGPRLGHGGMAEVFLAAREVAPFVHRPVVVKRIHTHFADDAALVQMFLDEARLLCLLDHPHIVKTLEAGVIDGQCCIAMEYLEGQPLHVVLRRAQEEGGLPVELVVYIVACILEGVGHAHSRVDGEGRSLGIVHRDVSPHNVCVTADGDVKMLDFGIAKAATQQGRTAAGMVKGKVGYIAPEQARAEPLDHRADLFSTGVILWEALTGKRLFLADTDAGSITLTLKGEIPAARSLRPDVPPALDAVIARALERQPARRHQSAREMRDALLRSVGLSDLGVCRSGLATLMKRAFARELLEQRRQVSMLIALSDCTPSSIRPAALPDGPHTTSALEVPSSVPPPEASPRPPHQRAHQVAAVLGVAALCAVATAIAMQALADGRAPGGAVVAPVTASVAPTERRPEPVRVAEAASASPAVVADRGGAPVGGNAASGERAHGDVVTRTVAATPAVVRPRAPSPVAAVHETPRPRTPPPESEPRDEPIPRSTRGGEVPSAGAPAAESPGFLTLDSSPWATVKLGGRSLGQTPLVHLELPAGTHVLTLENPELHLSATYTVTITSGQTIARRIGLE